MTKTELALLGLTEEDVLNRLVDRLAERFLDAGEDYRSEFEIRLVKAMETRVNQKMDAALEAHILPNIAKTVDEICIQKTNEYGEKKGDPLTFLEYLTQRADAYIREPVNYEGKAKGESWGSWDAKTTRIMYAIDKHLHYSVSQAMENAMKNATTSISKGLEEAAKIAIGNLRVSVKTDVSTK